MSTTPHFSIIIPSYNNMALLKECLESINNQTFRDFEVWIIDNVSNDGTQEFLASLKTPFYFISEKDSGIYNAMNKGIKVSKGSWLYFMGADDKLYDKSILDEISKVQNSDQEVILGNVMLSLSHKNEEHLGAKSSIFSSLLWLKNTIHHQGIFYRSDIFKKNKYDESYTVLADYKFHLQLYKKNVTTITTQIIVALCGNQGISKKFDWSLYKEEIRLKTEVSLVILKPLFWILGMGKYLIKSNVSDDK